jgi:phosphatidylserine decarboxylase
MRGIAIVIVEVPVSDRLKVLLQYVLPKQRLTTFAGRVAGAKGGAMTTRLIRWFAGKYGVDMGEAENSDLASYKSFNDFFTRPLKAGTRPLATADFVCPVDGAISQFGAIDDHHILQAKGHRFTTTELVGGDQALAARFRHGSFANLYLSPKDSSKHGPFAMVLVGATIVGSMATVWHGVVNPKRTGKISDWSYADRNIVLKQGEEMGRFLLGSTIVMLFRQGVIAFNKDWAPERSVRWGELMGDRPA